MYIPGKLAQILLTRFGTTFIPKALQTLESSGRNNHHQIVRGLLNLVLEEKAKEEEVSPFLKTADKEQFLLWKSWENPDFE